MGFGKFKMAASKLVMLTVLLSVTLELTSFGQKRVWRDDSTATMKADTSLVKIQDRYYQKFVVVTYREVTAENFDDELERLRQEREDMRLRFDSEREQYRRDIDVINQKIEAEAETVRKTRQEMKWLDKEERLKANPVKTEADIQNERREYFRSKQKN